MKLFKRKNIAGKRLEKQRIFERGIDVLNYGPEDYMLSKSWAVFMEHADKTFQLLIQRAKPDDLNPNLADPTIQANKNAMVAFANQQRSCHRRLIQHNRGVLGEQVKEYQLLLERLAEDLASIQHGLSALAKKEELE